MKIRRFIKKHLLSVILYLFIGIVCFGIASVASEFFHGVRGYYAIGGEVCIPLFLAGYLTLKIATRKG